MRAGSSAARTGVFDFAVVAAATDEPLRSVGFVLETHKRRLRLRDEQGGARPRRKLARRRLLTRGAARERGIARMRLIVEPGNAASIRVAEKAGFRREALLRSYIELHGTRRDVRLYSLLPEEL